MSGIPARELTAAEGAALFDRRCREELGIPGERFLAMLDAGALISGDPAAISRVMMLLPFTGRQP